MYSQPGNHQKYESRETDRKAHIAVVENPYPLNSRRALHTNVTHFLSLIRRYVILAASVIYSKQNTEL